MKTTDSVTFVQITGKTLKNEKNLNFTNYPCLTQRGDLSAREWNELLIKGW